MFLLVNQPPVHSYGGEAILELFMDSTIKLVNSDVDIILGMDRRPISSLQFL